MHETTHPFSAIIIDYKSLPLLFVEVHVMHILRKGNHCTDLFAKEGHRSHFDFVIHPHPPACIMYQLMANSCGIVYPRLCNPY